MFCTYSDGIMARYYLFPCKVHKKELDLVLVSISLIARYDVHAQVKLVKQW